MILKTTSKLVANTVDPIGEKLFQRYDDGREQQIDSWEDPAFEVYHQTDRYGFIHDKRLPQKNDPNETKAQAIEMERYGKCSGRN